MPRKALKIPLRVNITRQACRDIIGEAESKYWLDDYGYSWNFSLARLTVRNGKKGKGKDSGERLEPLKNHTITPLVIAQALSIMGSGDVLDMRGDPDEARKVFADVMKGMYRDGCGADGSTNDCVLQVAVFGKIIYG